jgi:hypothetical protein
MEVEFTRHAERARTDEMRGMKAMKRCVLLGLGALVCAGALAPAACRREPRARQYAEGGTDVPGLPAPAAARAEPGEWDWQKPSQWRQEAGTGLRLASFAVGDGDSQGLCTLVPLPGDGGGIEANVQRWLAELGLPPFSAKELSGFLGRQDKLFSRDRRQVTVFDFSTLVPGRAEPSLLVAIVPAGDQTLFVKLSGGKELLQASRDVFLAFCRSLSRGG